MKEKSTILFVTAGEGDEDRETAAILRKAGYGVLESHNGAPDTRAYSAGARLAILTARAGTSTLPKTVRHMRGFLPDMPIVVLSIPAAGDVIIETFRSGADDFLQYPISGDILLGRLEGLLAAVKTPAAHTETSMEALADTKLLGESRAMQLVRQRLDQVAASDATVLITGETGTGKDLAGEYIHRKSRRSLKPYIAVNCAALPEGLVESELFGFDKGAFTGADAGRRGKFELADGGTLFLDEIGEMPLQLQAKLLYAIEKKSIYRIGGRRAIPVDVKIVAATNRDIKHAVESGQFRIDLYYRLNIAYVEMPPLRHKKEDLELLIEHFIGKTAARYGRQGGRYSSEDMALLHRYEWPGNVRELQNMIEMSFIDGLGKQRGMLALPWEFRQSLECGGCLDERRFLVSALVANNWNKTKTAAALNWSRMTVHRKINKYRIVEKRNRDNRGKE